MSQKKASRRRITVDGVVYRYHVSPDDGYLALLVRSEASRGQWLWVKFSYHDQWVPSASGGHTLAGHRLILPRVVRLAILDGLEKGWNPRASEPGMFRVFNGDRLLPLEDWPRFAKPQPEPVEPPGIED